MRSGRSMRIIAGTLKGRRLTAPPGARVRPTSDSLRETLFNVLGTAIEGARVLDPFAGTGALGLEAISRGARHVTFVERDPTALRALERYGAEVPWQRIGAATYGLDGLNDALAAAEAFKLPKALVDPWIGH